MKKKSAEDYLDKLLNSVNDEKVKKEKFKETAKMLEDAMLFWEDGGADMDFEEASYMQAELKTEKKSEQEDFLDSLLMGAQNTEFGMNKKQPNANPMYSRRVSKSEADFLREFEAELAGSDDDLSDLFGQFDEKIEPEDRLEEDDIQMKEQSEDGSDLGDFDLAALLNEAAGVMESSGSLDSDGYVDTMGPTNEGDEIPLSDDISMDAFADLFGEDGGLNLADTIPVEGASDSIDLSNMGEEDLMSLLAGADGLSDIGDMLSQSDGIVEIPLDELDAFAAFAENEMAMPQDVTESLEDEFNLDGKAKGKKGGFLGKIKKFFAKILKDDEEDEVELKSNGAPTPEILSGENADILAELESLEEKPSGKKEKKKKEKKEKKEKKPKKEKAPKKPKAPKEPKPKKEKKPVEVDNTPPLPKGPVFMICLMVASLFALVLLGVNVVGYNTPISEAKSLMNNGHYAEAFAKVKGLDIKDKDLKFYDQLAVLSTVDSELNAYESFAKHDMIDKAFDSLICAAGRCELNEENADVYECAGQMETLRVTVSNELSQKFGMTYEEAIEMYNLKDRDEYTIALYKKLSELGIDWE